MQRDAVFAANRELGQKHIVVGLVLLIAGGASAFFLDIVYLWALAGLGLLITMRGVSYMCYSIDNGLYVDSTAQGLNVSKQADSEAVYELDTSQVFR